MKEMVIVVFAAIGGFAVYRYFERQRHSAWFNNAQNAPGGNYGFMPWATGGGDLYGQGAMMPAGIPVFNQTPAVNKPDQIVAFQKSNSMATIPQTGSQYVPAFGPQENRNGGLEPF